MNDELLRPFRAEEVRDAIFAMFPDKAPRANGRLITDNISVAAKVGHYLCKKTYGEVGWETLKLDMAKAYDRMGWEFLRCMLVGLGFAERWVNLIMLCVTLVRYNVMVNGDVAGVQTQGGERIHGCRVARGAPPMGFRNMKEVERRVVVGLLSVVQTEYFGKYLGLPSVVGRNKRAVFTYIEEKLGNRIGSRNRRFLS
ncbi:PREDICTED: uncharacterized protein LOC109182606 [Ipomoea nil]|uniref:uncharacterized protein LOC109182606 n=1 Tax=Ipomoea nil TaxID=35883 RepID=UPI0009013251|nr:PREDICTED: uncharacterized protein LOC109182606 [Ipomoea nil]